MTERKEEEQNWWRKPLIYTVVVVVAVSIGATIVFLVGSANRRSDRDSLVEYERKILPHLKEAGRIVQQEMKPTLSHLSAGDVTNAQLVERVAAWERAFERVRSDVVAIPPPVLLGEIKAKWDLAMGGYLLTVDAFKAIANAPPEQRAAAIQAATTFGERADGLFDDAAAIIQFHRKRLGLGPSRNLPDPTPSASG